MDLLHIEHSVKIMEIYSYVRVFSLQKFGEIIALMQRVSVRCFHDFFPQVWVKASPFHTVSAFSYNV